jgi:hypothetical protein
MTDRAMDNPRPTPSRLADHPSRRLAASEGSTPR